MILDCKISDKSAARSATARFDREFGNNDEGWLDRAAAQFRSAIIFQIPVGYQDETGFHCGIQHPPERISISAEREDEHSHPPQI